MLVPSERRKAVVVTVLGLLQILSWGSTFYLIAVLAGPIVLDTGWPYDHVVGGLSIGLLVAGIVSPRTGRAIGVYGGRPILALSAVLLSLGLALIGTSQTFVWYLAGWTVIGVGMGTGLYDAAFSALGSIYGKEARSAITAVTLFGGFASTVCWPFSAYLVEHFGWRSACFVYSAIYLGLALPLYLLALPRSASAVITQEPKPQIRAPTLEKGEGVLFAVLATVLTISAAILSLVGAHIVTLLQARGLELSAAVGLGMLIGPSAVGARLVEMFAGNRYHPIWTMIASASLVAVGSCMFLAGPSVFTLAIIAYASGNGIGSIAKGTLPLALFGAARYPKLMGRLALPIMFAMALAPFAGAAVFQYGGADWTFRMFVVMATTNLVLITILWTCSRDMRAQC